LIRQYYPKGKIHDKITESDIRKIEKELNNRPRKRLNYLTPYEVFVLGLDPEKDSRVQRLI
jgi:IS30 family transposase